MEKQSTRLVLLLESCPRERERTEVIIQTVAE